MSTTSGRDSDAEAARGELVDIRSPWDFGQLMQLLFLVHAPVPGRLHLMPDESTTRHFALTAVIRGRLPDAPATPPPKVA
ncbi:hypothetical protein [Thalassoglobus neptunius]|uniref:hypothetical protein n=1 Tax=Thalassoglobus neptunius TaxID=1938619 RepID=UPI001E4E5659|nr:hypothetical protein [Thalassoglobus neptunius]